MAFSDPYNSSKLSPRTWNGMLPNMEDRHSSLVTFDDAENSKEVLEERIDLSEQAARV